MEVSRASSSSKTLGLSTVGIYYSSIANYFSQKFVSQYDFTRKEEHCVYKIKKNSGICSSIVLFPKVIIQLRPLRKTLKWKELDLRALIRLLLKVIASRIPSVLTDNRAIIMYNKRKAHQIATWASSNVP